MPLTTLAQRLYEAARAAGHGGADLAAVATALEALEDREADGAR